VSGAIRPEPGARGASKVPTITFSLRIRNPAGVEFG
jgi:hypothetical protein